MPNGECHVIYDMLCYVNVMLCYADISKNISKNKSSLIAKADKVNFSVLIDCCSYSKKNFKKGNLFCLSQFLYF